MLLTDRPLRRATALALALFALLTASGCTGTDTLTDEDRRGLDQLAEIAPRDAEIDGVVTGVECWNPSDNLVEESTFRVLCRVHYDQRGGARYRDMICIGDLSEEPVAEYCVEWAYYSDMPRFEDQRGHSSEETL